MNGKIYAGLNLVTGPAEEPVTLEDVKFQLKKDSVTTYEDEWLTGFISLARQWCENYMRRAFVAQTWELALRAWPGRDVTNYPIGFSSSSLDTYYKHNYIKLPRPPLRSVSSINYYDTTNTMHTMPAGNIAGGYNVNTDTDPGQIVLPFSQIWPTEILLPGSPIKVTFVAGFVDAATFLATFEGALSVRMAILLLVAHWDTVRQPLTNVQKMRIGGDVLQPVKDLLEAHRNHENLTD